jgi:8-oxo-dGTP pyrophosphatase MutT (NUDIX family)
LDSEAVVAISIANQVRKRPSRHYEPGKVGEMPNPQPYVTTVDEKRSFACFPAAVLVLIVNEKEEILLLSHPERKGRWEVVNGAMEAGETVLEGALREAREEIGENARIRPLGVVHASTFHYDEAVQYMLSLCYLMAYEGGAIRPGDDMRGSEHRWWSLGELAEKSVRLIVPPGQKWLVGRAVELYRLWKEQDVALYPGLDPSAGKYDMA